MHVLRYADGDHVGGSLSQDRLTWGGLAVNNQVFAEISDAETFTITCVEDGLLGMSFDELASSKQVGPQFRDIVVAPRYIFQFLFFFLTFCQC